jgi:hypothetical protein
MEQSQIREIFRKKAADLMPEEARFRAECESKAAARAREYKGDETENFVPENTLTPDREAELKRHLAECEIPYFGCDQCFELYQNIGYQGYAVLVEAAGPTESEQSI